MSCVQVYGDGSGPALFVGGTFSDIGGLPANRIAKWDGETWTTLGVGLAGLITDVYAMEVFDDGGGPALFVAGEF